MTGQEIRERIERIREEERAKQEASGLSQEEYFARLLEEHGDCVRRAFTLLATVTAMAERPGKTVH